MPCKQALRHDWTNPNHWRHARKDSNAGEDYVKRPRIVQHAAKDRFFNLGRRSHVGQDGKGDVGGTAEPDPSIGANSVSQFVPHKFNRSSGGIVERRCYGIRHELNVAATVMLVCFPAP
jgi:hypothetical protein